MTTTRPTSLSLGGGAHKTVFLTSEDDATDGAPTMLEPLPEVDAIA